LSSLFGPRIFYAEMSFESIDETVGAWCVAGSESWAYLGEGVMVETDFSGLVHYATQIMDTIELLERLAPPE
jgi:hypothetical protein